MEVRSDLATGHARTANARTRVRNGWTEIATVLNSIGNGCIKDWKQWAKYWKDKKAATKRKANIAESARQRTGGGVNVEVVELSDLEQKILTISGGLSFATGDRNLGINPFPEQGNNDQPPLGSETSGHSESILQQLHELPEPSGSVMTNVFTVMEDPQLQWNETTAAVVGDTVAENLLSPTLTTTPPGECEQTLVEMVSPTERNIAAEMSTIRPNIVGGAQRSICFDSPSRRRGSSVPAAAQRCGARSQQRPRIELTSPRRSGRAGRRRLLQRSPPSQRRSEMASLTERFIAIEERRAEAELASAQSRLTLARAWEATAQGPNIIAAAIDRFGDMIRDVTRQTILHL